MKKLTQTLLPFLMGLMLVFAVGCESSSENDELVQEDEDEYTYSIVFQLTTLSDAYLDFGTITLNYLDSDGQTKSINVTKGLVPSQLAVSDLSVGDSYSFELKFDRLETLPSLTEDGYVFSYYYSAYYERSDGVKNYLVVNTGGSLPIVADGIETYVDEHTGKNIITFSGTISK